MHIQSVNVIITPVYWHFHCDFQQNIVLCNIRLCAIAEPLVIESGLQPPCLKVKDIHFFDAQSRVKFGPLSMISW